MSDGIVPRLRSVDPSPSAGGMGDIPVEIIRFATLPEDRRALLIRLSDLLDQIAFGSIVMVTHDGEVTQIEMSEKIRLPGGPSANE